REARNPIASRTPENQRFVSRRQPAQIERVPFEQQRQNIQARQSFVRPAEQQQLQQPRIAPPEGQRNWRRFGDPTSGTSTPGTPTPGTPTPGTNARPERNAQRQQLGGQENGGQRNWGRFGEPA